MTLSKYVSKFTDISVQNNSIQFNSFIADNKVHKTMRKSNKKNKRNKNKNKTDIK